MKKTIILFALFISFFSLSQVPEGINYQATLRNEEGNLYENEELTIKIAIRKNTSDGTVIYEENHTVTTDAYGGIQIVIGKGTVSEGIFQTINWGGSLHFVSTSIDGQEIGTSQLLSVPYAMHTKTAENILNPIWREKNNKIVSDNSIVVIGDSIGANSTTTLDIKEKNVATGKNMINVEAERLTGTASAIEINIEETNGVAPLFFDFTRFLSFRKGSDEKIGIYTNGRVSIDSTLIIKDGEINRTQTGNANLVPVAYGKVRGNNASIIALQSTNNFNVVRNGTGDYRITIDGVSDHTNYLIQATCVALSNPEVATIYTSLNHIGVRIWSLSTANPRDSDFTFVVYKK